MVLKHAIVGGDADKPEGRVEGGAGGDDAVETRIARALRFLDPDAVRARLAEADADDDRLCAALRLGERPSDVAIVLADPRVARQIDALAREGVIARAWNTDASSQMHGIVVERALETVAA